MSSLTSQYDIAAYRPPADFAVKEATYQEPIHEGLHRLLVPDVVSGIPKKPALLIIL